MKHLLIITLIGFLSCSPTPEPYQSAITTKFKEIAHDPASFEYVETVKIDTLTMNEWRRNSIESDIKYLKMDSSNIEFRKTSLGMTIQYGNADAIAESKAEVQKAIDELAASHAEIDSLKKTTLLPDSNAVKVVNVLCKIRSKNKMGALVLEQYSVQFLPDMTINAVDGPI